MTAPAQLRIGHGPWSLNEGRPPWTRPRSSFRTGVLIVGAGITGSLLAQHLVQRGHRVAVVDRLAPGQGSTAASTAMLQWEIDKSLVELGALYGMERAARIYRQSLAAVQGLGALAAHLGIACHWRARPALYLAGDGASADTVREEHAARHAADLPGALLDAGRLHDMFGIARAAAIYSPGAAEADPVLLAHGLLTDALIGGAQLVHGDVETYEFDSRHACATLTDGHQIEADWLILATGYTMPPFVPANAHKLSASWAAVTPPGTPLGFWRDHALVWEDAQPYLYARTTADGRILVGGEDEPMDDPAARERVTPAKAAAMHAKLEAMWGRTLPPFETAWSAAFGESEDGLPLIGPVPGCPRAYVAYGYGGNGITYSYLAARMIGAWLAGEAQSWFANFALDRPAPG